MKLNKEGGKALKIRRPTRNEGRKKEEAPGKKKEREEGCERGKVVC